MKKTALILLLFAAFTTISAQQYVPFPTDSAQWSVRHTITSPFSQNTIQYKMKGDTVLNGITYHKIYYSLDLAYSSPNQTLHCFIREDTTKKVFVKYPANMGVDTSEFILYDFNVAIGDTVTIRLFYFAIDSVFKLQIYSISSWPTNIDSRKYYQLITFGSPVWPCLDPDWIDGAGSTFGPFYNEVPQNECGYEISCFWHKGIYIMGGTECDISTGIEEKQDIDYQSSMFPNPAQNTINFKINFEANPANSNLIIRDVIGRQMSKYTITVKNTPIIVNTEQFSNGIYFYSVYNNGVLKEKGKFIISK